MTPGPTFVDLGREHLGRHGKAGCPFDSDQQCPVFQDAVADLFRRAGADAHAGGKPDPALLAAVRYAMDEAARRGVTGWPIADVALAAAGRVLAQALDAEAADYNRVAGGAAFPEIAYEIGQLADRTRDCAALVRRLCGVPEGDEGGGD